jgi:hypothetical protein
VNLSDILYVAGGGAAGLLLNITANKVPDRYHAPLLRWGWFAIALYFTILIMNIDFIQRRLVLTGRSGAISYVIAAVIAAAIGVTYWFIINRIHSTISDAPQDNRKEPNLTGKVLDIVKAFGEGESHLFICIALKNTGEPTVVHGFPLDLKGEFINIRDAHPEDIPEQGYTLTDPKGKVVVNLQRNHGIHVKLAGRLLEKNNEVAGWLHYRLKGVTEKQLSGEVEYTVIFSDVNEENLLYAKRTTSGTSLDGVPSRFYIHAGNPFAPVLQESKPSKSKRARRN